MFQRAVASADRCPKGSNRFRVHDDNGWHSIETRRGDTGIELRSTGELELLVSIATCHVPASATDPPVWSPAALSKCIVGVPMPLPVPEPNWRHPDIATSPGLGALMEVVYREEQRRAPLRVTVTSTWYGRPGGPPGDAPVTRQAEVFADGDQARPSAGSPYNDLLGLGRLIPTLDLEFGDAVEAAAVGPSAPRRRRAHGCTFRATRRRDRGGVPLSTRTPTVSTS